MKFIENPVIFLKNIRNVYYNISRLLNEENDKSEFDDAVVLFRTGGEYPYGEKTIPYIEAFSFIDKPEYYDEIFVEPTNPQFSPVIPIIFMLFSLDNEHYVDYFSKIKNNYFDIQKEIQENENNPDFCYYVCDITRSFYCKITMEYHQYFKEKMSESIVSSSEGNVKLIHWYNELSFYYSYLINEENFISPYEIEGFVLCSFDWNSDYNEVYNAEYIQLAKEDIFDINTDISEYEARDEAIKNSSICLEQMDELLNRKHPNDLSVFGERVNVPTLDELTNKYVFMTPVVYMLNSEINSRKIADTRIKKGLNEEFAKSKEILIDRTIKNDYNAEDAAQNVYDYIWTCTINYKAYVYPFFEYALLANPKTIYLYDALNELGSDVVTNYALDLQNDEQIMEVVEELPATLYYNQFYSQMQSYLEHASSIKEKVDNFQGGFVGGGFGIGGALKGILMASVANAVVETAYSLHQYKKIDYDTINDYLKEFLKTEHSKAFISEMMVLDIKYLFIKSLSILNEMEKSLEGREKEEQKLVRQMFGMHWYKDLLNGYVRSFKFYAIALAKQLNLTIVPEYEGFESYYEMKPTALLEEAILAFPYDSLYYEQYLNFGGEITKELEEFAALNLVDLSSVRQRYETRQKVQRELDEKLRKEEEERKRKEQEAEAERIRKEQEAKEAAQKKLAETFGDIAKEYSELFTMMLDNPIFKANLDRKFTTHQELTSFIFDYINQNFKGITTSMFPVTSPQFSQKLRNLQNIHGYQVVTKDNALFCFDNTVFGSGKDGFVLTRNALCYRNMMGSPVHVALKNIKTIKVVNGEICINENKNINVALCKLKRSDLLDILNYCICNLLVMPEPAPIVIPKQEQNNTAGNGMLKERGFIQQTVNVLNESNAMRSRQQTSINSWKCSCGATNNETCLFCPSCGLKRIQNTDEWICAKCGRKNPKQFVFCGSCGTKKETEKKEWFCTACGTKNPATSVFCGACGKKSE